MEHPPELKLDVHFQDDSVVPLHALAEIAENLEEILKEYAIAYTERLEIHWVITTLGIGSIDMGVIPDVRQTDIEVDQIRRITHQILSDAKELELGALSEEILPSGSGAHWQRWITLLRTGVVTTFGIRADNEAVVMTREGAGSVKTSVDRRRVHGTLRGTIKGVNFAAANYCSLYRIEGGRALKCYFSDDMEQHVISALRKRVDVTGMINTDSEGKLQSLRITSPPRILRDEIQIPKIDDLVGIAPDLTEGLDPVEWVRRQRVE